MANRGIADPNIIAAIGQSTTTYYECVDFAVGPGYYVTNAPRDMYVNSTTYHAFGQFLGFGAIEENAVFDINKITLSVSAIAAYDNNGDKFAQVLLNSNYIDKPVNVWRVYFDSANQQIGSIKLFEGLINGAGIKVSVSGESAVSVEVSNHWVDFKRSNGLYTNVNSHQSRAYASTDLGFEYAKEVQKEITWKAPS
jgi:hypothetical protein